jgi:hypothetical protein
VWDPLNGDEDSARTYEAVGPEAAAEQYAEQDAQEGHGELYDDAHALLVRACDNPSALFECVVQIECVRRFDVQTSLREG